MRKPTQARSSKQLGVPSWPWYSLQVLETSSVDKFSACSESPGHQPWGGAQRWSDTEISAKVGSYVIATGNTGGDRVETGRGDGIPKDLVPPASSVPDFGNVSRVPLTRLGELSVLTLVLSLSFACCLSTEEGVAGRRMSQLARSRVPIAFLGLKWSTVGRKQSWQRWPDGWIPEGSPQDTGWMCFQWRTQGTLEKNLPRDAWRPWELGEAGRTLHGPPNLER